jgi:hypothetical protein
LTNANTSQVANDRAIVSRRVNGLVQVKFHAQKLRVFEVTVLVASAEMPQPASHENSSVP